jgi:hypothetical protein
LALEPDPPVIDDQSFKILATLARFPGRLLTIKQLKGHLHGSGIGLQTIKRKLTGLIDNGLAARPRGERSGATITGLGLKAIEKAETEKVP